MAPLVRPPFSRLAHFQATHLAHIGEHDQAARQLPRELPGPLPSPSENTVTVGRTDDGSCEVMKPPTDFSGLRIHPEFLDRNAQMELLAAVRNVLAEAPFYTPRMPKSGRPFTVRMSNCGPLGWVSDEAGYRYQATHPDTGRPWPPMPPALLKTWSELAEYPKPPEACLINFYGLAAKMGLHQDRDEADFSAPVISISLGDSCLFRVGGLSAATPRARSASVPATRSFLAARPGSLSTASTGSIREHRACSQRADGSI